MRNRFDEQLFELNKEIIEMGAMCEEAIAKAVKALNTGDVVLAKSVKDGSGGIDQMERAIESRCMKLLLHQQPVARDLRLISAALKMITDMERIGDHAADISEMTLHLTNEPYINNLVLYSSARSAGKVVEYCGKEYVDTNYYSSNSIFFSGGKLPYCKQCIERLYQRLFDEYADEGCLYPERKAVKRLCMAFDIYYSKTSITIPVGYDIFNIDNILTSEKRKIDDETAREEALRKQLENRPQEIGV